MLEVNTEYFCNFVSLVFIGTGVFGVVDASCCTTRTPMTADGFTVGRQRSRNVSTILLDLS